MLSRKTSRTEQLSPGQEGYYASPCSCCRFWLYFVGIGASCLLRPRGRCKLLASTSSHIVLFSVAREDEQKSSHPFFMLPYCRGNSCITSNRSFFFSVSESQLWQDDRVIRNWISYVQKCSRKAVGSYD